MSEAFAVEWCVVWVQTPALLDLPQEIAARWVELQGIAASLGAEIVTLRAPLAAAALANYAELRNTSHILIGSSMRRGWRSLVARSIPAQLLRACARCIVITMPRQWPFAPAARSMRPSRQLARCDWRNLAASYFSALALTALSTAVGLLVFRTFDLTNIVMIYMLGATVAGLKLGRGPAAFNALANIAACDYFFIPPRYSFSVAAPQYLLTLAVMLVVALVIANLMIAVRQQTAEAGARERRTATLYAVSRELAIARDADTMSLIAVRHIAEVFHGAAVVMVRDERGDLHESAGDAQCGFPCQPDLAIARWVAQHRQPAGLGMQHEPSAHAIYLPLIGSQDSMGVLCIRPAQQGCSLTPEPRRLLEALAGQLALTLERVRLAAAAETARVTAERAALRSTLLASISHDLRTPLSAIAGAGSMMAREDFALDLHRRMTLGRLIEDKARDMTELLSNILELMRLESDTSALRREWHALDDLVGLARQRNEARLTGWLVLVDVASDLPMVSVEATLIVQMLSNLLENATKYTPRGTTIRVSASAEAGAVLVSVEDDGPGFKVRDPERLFEKFERGRTEGNVGGVGLGLAICRAVARLHGGDINAMTRAGGGVRFEIRLPAEIAAAEREAADSIA